MGKSNKVFKSFISQSKFIEMLWKKESSKPNALYVDLTKCVGTSFELEDILIFVMGRFIFVMGRFIIIISNENKWIAKKRIYS